MNQNGEHKITVYDHPRYRVNLLVGADFLACQLGALGFSTEAIQKQTGLSSGQVNYRLKRALISRNAYRSGNSLVARKILSFAKMKLTPVIEAQLIKALKAPPKEKRANVARVVDI